MTDTSRPAAGDAVSVVIPTHDRLDLLRATLGAVFAQHDVELRRVIVVDDASSDDTPAFLDAVADPRLSVVRHDVALGAPSARNAGLALVDTPWVGFCDNDDLWAPDALRSMLDALATQPDARWACLGAVYVDEQRVIRKSHRPPPSGPVYELLADHYVIPGGGSGMMAATDLAKAIGGFDPSTGLSSDWDFAVRLAAESPLAAVDRPLLAYRISAGSTGHQTRAHAESIESVRAKLPPVDAATTRRRRLDDANLMVELAARGGHRRPMVESLLACARIARRPGYVLKAAQALVNPASVAQEWADAEGDALDRDWAAPADNWISQLRPLDLAHS